MKKQGGFTLIELVVVIVILGILAVTAAPRFLNLQGDAREASLQGLRGAMQGAAGIVYGKAAIDGSETSSSAVNVTAGSTTVSTIFGYPVASSAGIGAAVAGLAEDWDEITSAGQPTDSISYTFDGTTTAGCHVNYERATSAGDEPTITVVTTGC
ncbi:type II secretion system GspH family protein [Vibrio sp. Isolate23]|uniref:prepilin-type N-terminal cleavage/methylation domain-containing protein n=1 Tax=Vibrio sp. Isolate23 TaxID=2908533 RepID=UPI001EFCA9F6|nr:type II secretion system protein [Vibrio sp. Isolate23]MCG9680993.1 type II secretion system GspH family protein [Vibrio sp. Isolate23]